MNTTRCPQPAVSLFLFLLFCLIPSAAHAKADRNWIDIGFSATSYQLNRQASEDSGKTSVAGTSFYHLYLQGNLPLGKSFGFSPNLRYGSPFTVKSPDGGSTSSLTALGLPLLYKKGAFAFGGGPMLLRYEINGKGGTIVMNNGNSQATFGLPGNKVATTTTALTLTSQVDWKSLLFGLDIVIHGMGSAEKRSTSLALALAYGFGG